MIKSEHIQMYFLIANAIIFKQVPGPGGSIIGSWII